MILSQEGQIFKIDPTSTDSAKALNAKAEAVIAKDEALAAKLNIEEELIHLVADVEVWSYDQGVLPDSTGVVEGAIGAYFKNDGVLIKVEWNGTAWVEIGEPISTKKYVDDKASLLSDDLIENTSEEVGKSIITSLSPNNHPTTDDVSPTVSFIFDSARRELIEDAGRGNGFPTGGFKQVFADLGVKFSISGGWHSDYWGDGIMNQSEALQLQDEGYELMTHVRVSPNLNHTEEEAFNAIKAQKEEILEQGVRPKNSNYFQGVETAAYRSAIRKFYRSGATTSPGSEPWINTRPINQYRLRRLTMDEGTYNTWVEQIDFAYENNQPVILYGHAYEDHWYEQKRDDDGNPDENGDYTWQKIQRIIEYVQAKADYNTDGGIKIVQIDEMLDIHGNLIDSGVARDFRDSIYGNQIQTADMNADYFRLSKRGEIRSRKLDVIDVNDGDISVGFKAGWGNTAPNKTLLGNEAGSRSGGSSTVAIGFRAGRFNEGNSQTVVGRESGLSNTGLEQTAIGRSAGQGNVGSQQVAIGDQAGIENEGNEVSVVGAQAGVRNTHRGLSALGYRAGGDNKGIFGSFLGGSAGRRNEGGYVVGIGYLSALDNTANNLVAIGDQAGRDNDIPNRFIVHHNNGGPQPLIDGDFATGSLVIGSPPNSIHSSRIGPNRFTFFLDESENKLKVRVKYADGTTLADGEINLTIL